MDSTQPVQERIGHDMQGLSPREWPASACRLMALIIIPNYCLLGFVINAIMTKNVTILTANPKPAFTPKGMLNLSPLNKQGVLTNFEPVAMHSSHRQHQHSDIETMIC